MQLFFHLIMCPIGLFKNVEGGCSVDCKSYDLFNWIKKLICDFVNHSQENSLGDTLIQEKIWNNPLIGISRGDDSLYEMFKKDIGEFYWTPYEIFNMTFPQSKVCSSNLSVISWILPHNKNTKIDNSSQVHYPSERWVRARIYGEDFNRKVALYLEEELKKQGYKAVSPMLSKHFEHKKSERYGYASTWSERHAAYVSGLGTFGLCDGLITKVGKAMRCGSLIVNLNIEPTNREYSHHNEYCLNFSNKECMKCARRCPVNAIDENGHDKNKCRGYHRKIIEKYANKNYNIQSFICGLCQTGTPCESEIPKYND